MVGVSGLTALFGLAGLAALIGLVATNDVGQIAAMLQAGGWALFGACLFHFLPMVSSARAWQVLLPRRERRSMVAFSWYVWIREGVNALLPVVKIGGEFVSARLMMRDGIRAESTVSSLVVDLTVSLASQLIFTLLGLVLLLIRFDDPGIVAETVIGMLLALPVIGLVILVQRHGFFGLLAGFVRRAFGDKWTRYVGSHLPLDEAVRGIYRRRGDVAQCLFFQLGNWLLGAVELWLVARAIGIDLAFLDLLLLEAIAQAIASAAFLVPGQLGVQEGGFVAIGTMLGLSPEASLALALSRRLRDLILYVPALILWQWIEGRRLFPAARRHPPDPVPPAPAP